MSPRIGTFVSLSKDCCDRRPPMMVVLPFGTWTEVNAVRRETIGVSTGLVSAKPVTAETLAWICRMTVSVPAINQGPMIKRSAVFPLPVLYGERARVRGSRLLGVCRCPSS